MYERVSKRESRIARQRATALIRDVQNELKASYTFMPRLVGSGAWGTMVKDENGEYDLDYQLILTRNSKKYNKGNDSFPNPKEIKRDFISAFQCSLNDGEKIEDSKTAITLINDNGKPYHIDFVIMKTLPENNYIIRRNNKIGTPTVNEYTWNELPGWNDAYTKFKNLPLKDKQYLIETIIIPLKQQEKAKKDTDDTKISSSALFVREVNNYICRTKTK